MKESLIGFEDESATSSQTQKDFMEHAIRDEETDDWYMDERAFVDAVAPESEDYVGITLSSSCC